MGRTNPSDHAIEMMQLRSAMKDAQRLPKGQHPVPEWEYTCATRSWLSTLTCRRCGTVKDKNMTIVHPTNMLGLQVEWGDQASADELLLPGHAVVEIPPGLRDANLRLRDSGPNTAAGLPMTQLSVPTQTQGPTRLENARGNQAAAHTKPPHTVHLEALIK